MNTIKIYLEESGEIAILRKDFTLYQGQYQSKLLNVYVPTNIVATECVVKIGIKHVDRSGAIKLSRNFAMKYVKDVTYNGVEYALFERLLPKEFTMYVGEGQNAPRLVINVVDITDEANPTVLSVITSQECNLDVMPSANLDNDETLDPTALEEINAELNALNTEMAQKQDKEDMLLETTSKTVVGGINENKGNIDANTTNIASNSEQIAGLRNDIADLTARVESGENYIGQMEGENMPTSAQLNQFVEDTVARATTAGDVVIFVLDSDPKRNYKFTYFQSGWAGYELTAVSKADNDIYGLLKGTYGINSTNEVLLDINNGEVLHIWVKDGETYRDLKEYLGANKTNIAEIINGTQTVGKAVSATTDSIGNNIVSTYLTQSAGATKEYVKDYAMPKQFSNVYFVTANGYDGLDGTSSDPIFTETTSSVGEHQIIKGDNVSSDLAMTLDADFEVSIANAYQNTFWLEASADCDVEFKLTTQYQKAGQEWTDLNIELSEQYSLTAETITRVDFSSQFLSLGDTTVELVAGDKIRQILSVKTQTSDSITFDVYSYSTYPSTFNLLVSNYTPMGATTVYVDGSPVTSWNADTKSAVTSSDTVVPVFNADTKMNKENPSGTGSISINRMANTTVGSDSVAVGYNTTASGDGSHAEGGSTTASGAFAHSEGSITHANGYSSHAEGFGTEANGKYSHAEGHDTVSNYRSQHVFGEFNIEDVVENGSADNRGNYVEIVGNGTVSTPSNARTLDWNGNEVLGGTLQSAGFKDGNNVNYKAVLPNTASWTADKTLATVLIGEIKIFAGSTVPDGYLMCNGQEVSRTEYAELFAVIGTTYGVGDNSTTFNIPDYRGRVVIGTSLDYQLGSTGGNATHKHDILSSHTIAHVVFNTNLRNLIIDQSNGDGTSWTTGTELAISNTSTSSNTYTQGVGVHGYTEETSNVQPYLAQNYIIRAK